MYTGPTEASSPSYHYHSAKQMNEVILDPTDQPIGWTLISDFIWYRKEKKNGVLPEFLTHRIHAI